MGLGFVASLAGNAFENDSKIKRVIAPLVVIHGTQDKVIPIDMGRKVFDAATSQKSFYDIQEADHNNISRQFADRYWPIVSKFINQKQ